MIFFKDTYNLCWGVKPGPLVCKSRSQRTNQLARASMNATYLTKAHCLPPRKESSRFFQCARVCEAKYRKRYLSLSRDYPDPNLGTKCNRNTYYLCWSLNRGHLACKSNTLPIELKGKPTGQI